MLFGRPKRIGEQNYLCLKQICNFIGKKGKTARMDKPQTKKSSVIANEQGLRRALATAILSAFITLILPRSAAALTAAQANLIYQGYVVFNTQSFNGNGRTCATCHVPQHDFTTSAADIAALALPAHDLLQATKNQDMENPTLVDELGLFNITDTEPGAVGTGDTPVGPFRASMSIGGLAFTTLNACPNSAPISSVTSDPSTGFETVVVAEPIGLVSVEPGEPVIIYGTNNAAFNVGGGTPLNSLPIVQSLGDPVVAIEGLSDTTEFTVACESKGSLVACPSGSSQGGDVTALTPCPNAAAGGVAGAGNIDDGTRFIELGWAGDGTPTDPSLFDPAGTKDTKCEAAVEAFDANPTSLDLALNAFSAGAVRHHFARTQNRVPGVDFTCPTTTQLNELTAFQEYLGRQFELALCATDTTDPYCTGDEYGAQAFASGANGTQIESTQSVVTFNDPVAEAGKAIFLDNRASCNACHFNAGANGTLGQTKANPPVTVTPSDTDLFFARNVDSHTNVELLRSTSFPAIGDVPAFTALDDLTGSVVIPQDPGDRIPGGAAAVVPTSFTPAGGADGAFNTQSIIEAARKSGFFHNDAFTTIEQAESFYFSPIFDGSQSGAGAVSKPLRGCSSPTGCGAASLEALAATYTNTDDPEVVLDTLGFFFRALSTVYSLEDAERLTQDAISIASLRTAVPTLVQALNFNNDLNDIANVLNGAQVTLPSAYVNLLAQVPSLQNAFRAAAAAKNITALNRILSELEALQESIATISPPVS
jgi:cytochrome c peroxidase